MGDGVPQRSYIFPAVALRGVKTRQAYIQYGDEKPMTIRGMLRHLLRGRSWRAGGRMGMAPGRAAVEEYGRG